MRMNFRMFSIPTLHSIYGFSPSGDVFSGSLNSPVEFSAVGLFLADRPPYMMLNPTTSRRRSLLMRGMQFRIQPYRRYEAKNAAYWSVINSIGCIVLNADEEMKMLLLPLGKHKRG